MPPLQHPNNGKHVAVADVGGLVVGTDRPVTFLIAVAGLGVLLRLAWDRRPAEG